jgi:hypothetical protein
MFETQLDLTHLSAMYSVYGGLFLILLRMIWLWNIEYQFCASNQTFKEKCFFVSFHYYKAATQSFNPIITWILRYIRKKISSSRDEDIFDFLHNLSY